MTSTSPRKFKNYRDRNHALIKRQNLLSARNRGIAARQGLFPRNPPYEDDRALLWLKGWDEQDSMYYTLVNTEIMRMVLVWVYNHGIHSPLMEAAVNEDWDDVVKYMGCDGEGIQTMITKYFPEQVLDKTFKYQTKKRQKKKVKWRRGKW